jgi:hypothetical protein
MLEGVFLKRGKVISVRTGSNPNSSSLGVDVTWLLGGGALVGLLTLVGGTLTRWALRQRKGG